MMSKISDAMERSKRERDERVFQEESAEPRRTVLPAGGGLLSSIPEGDVEQYHALASEIFLALPETPSRSLMFVSAVPGEGTSLIAREFTRTLAESAGVSTLLLDANLRRPSIHDEFGVVRDPGLSDYVMSSVPLQECLRSVRSSNLVLLPAGRRVVAPPRVLMDPRTEHLLTELRERFNYVVLDMPPLLSFSEGVPISRMVDGVILVIRSGHTKRELVERALELLGDAGANVLGTVLNRRKFHIPRMIYDRL